VIVAMLLAFALVAYLAACHIDLTASGSASGIIVAWSLTGCDSTWQISELQISDLAIAQGSYTLDEWIMRTGAR
jgi:hypothetical protein